MNYRQRKQRVVHAEQQLLNRLGHSAQLVTRLRATWRLSLSPLRVLGGGMISGFVLGKLRPTRLSRSALLHSKSLIQLPTLLLSLAPLLERLQHPPQHNPPQADQTDDNGS